MNIENLEQLKEALKYRGFGDGLYKELEKNMQSGVAEFQLTHNSKIGGDNISNLLYFKKHKEEDKYYFNKFDVTLQPADAPDQQLVHTFYADQKITAKEAYNLLKYGEQTAVNKNLFNKDNNPYNTWITLDLKGAKDEHNNYPVIHYHENYYKKHPFDVKESLNQLPVPVKEIEEGKYLDSMATSLRRGNAVNVTIQHEGREQSGALLVNAKAGRVEVYDEKMQLIVSEQQKQQESKKESQTQGQGDEKKKFTNGQQVNWTKNNATRRGVHQ